MIMNIAGAVICTILLSTVVHCAPKIDESRATNDVRSYFQKVDKLNQTLSNTCNDCKLVVSELKNVIGDPAKLNRLKVVLKLMCDYIGGSEAQECKNMIDNLDFIIHQLGPFLDDPEHFCKELHLCSQSKISTYSLLTLKAMRFIVRSANKEPTNDVLCDECVFAATELNSLLRNTNVQQQLKQELEQICKILSSYEHKCNEAVEAYFPVLLQFLESLVSNPQHFCAEVKMCHTSLLSRDVQSRSKIRKAVMHKVQLKRQNYDGRLQTFMFLAPTIQTSRGHNAMCIVCEYGFKSLIQQLNRKNAVISKQMSELFCDMLPDSLEDDCADFASTYASSLFSMFVNEWSPQEICTEIEMCTNETVNALDSMSEAERQSTVCEACHTFAQFLSYEFRQPPLQQQLTALVKENICTLLPGDLSNQCLDTADQYVPMIMQRISDYVIGENFCKEMGMCGSEQELISNEQ